VSEEYDNEFEPVQSWELPDQRKRIPIDLQQIVGATSRVVRVHPDLDRKFRVAPDQVSDAERELWGKHKRDLEPYKRLSELFAGWTSIRRKPAEEGRDIEKWEIICQEDKIEYLVVIGPDPRDGRFNLITFFRPRKPSYLGKIKEDPATVTRKMKSGP